MASVEASADEVLTPAAPPVKSPSPGLLAASYGLREVFEGEAREHVLAALRESLDAAKRSGKDRRAAVLEDVLSANPPSGELDRRRAELKQVLKDCGYYTDPSALEKLGFRLISGRTHWKLQYADVRIPLAKTPSDYRASLNTSSEMANRCF